MMSQSRLGSLRSTMSKTINHSIYDTDSLLASTLHNIWKRFTNPSERKMATQRFQETEDEKLAVVMGLLSEQTPTIPKLTEGEKVARKIRDLCCPESFDGLALIIK